MSMLCGRVKDLPGSNVKAPATRMRQVLTFGQIRLAPTQSFCDALCSVTSTDVPTNSSISSIIEYGTTNRVDVLQPRVRAYDAVIVDVSSLLLQRLLGAFVYMLAILRVESLPPHLACGRTSLRVKFKNSEHLI